MVNQRSNKLLIKYAPLTGALRVDTAERDAEILRLRAKEGLSTRSIGERVGLSHQTVQTIIRNYLAETVAPEADELRKLEDERIEELMETWWPKAKENLGALDRVIRLMERKARLHGLDRMPNVNIDARSINIENINQMTPEQIAALASAPLSTERPPEIEAEWEEKD